MSNRTAAENLQKYFELSKAFHSPKGDGYKTVRGFLEKYLDLKFIFEQNLVKYRSGFFDKGVEHLFNAVYPEEIFNDNKAFSTEVLLRYLDSIVCAMENHKLKKYREYGRILRVTYMTPEYADLDIFTLFDVLNMSQKTYYRIRSQAISLVSEIFFGTLVGENGFTDLERSNNGVYLAK